MIPFIYTQHFCLEIFCCGLQAATSEVETLLHVPAETWGQWVIIITGQTLRHREIRCPGWIPQVSTLAIMLHLPLRKEIGIQGNLFSFGPDILMERRTLLVLQKASRILYCLSVAYQFCIEYAINPVINGWTP